MQRMDAKILDRIAKQTISAVKESKAQIFDIYEAARQQMKNVEKDVEHIRFGMAETIMSVDELEKKLRLARLRLVQVSRNFRLHSDAEIKEAYETANNLQIELAVARATELNLRRRRDEAELSMRNLKHTVQKAESLASQVGTVLGYLAEQIDNVVLQVETLQQRQKVGGKIIKAQEAERRRVAREIHDGPAQSMANIVFRAEVCEKLTATDMDRAKNELKSLREQVRFCLKEIRKIIFDLRPMTLDDLGLVPTLHKILATLKEQAGIEGELKIVGEEKRLSSYIEIGVFRSIQEALNNVAKHSRASKVIIRLEFTSAFVSAVVEDNGRGFDVAANHGSQSFGLLGMTERVKILDGEITVKSEKNKGTRVFIQVPLNSKEK